MKALFSITRVLTFAVAMFSFASGAWAEDEGDGIVQDDEVVSNTDVTGEEELLDTEVVGEEAQSGPSDEVIMYTMGGEDGAEVADGTGYVDAEGNVIYVEGDEGGGPEVEFTPLMATSGIAGGAVSLADTAADQAGIDSANDLNVDVVGSTAGDFASPIDVATLPAAGSSHIGNGGAATRISGGHLDNHQ